MIELDLNECETLLEHLRERQEGCMFIGNICDIVRKLEEEVE
jgi:hypothetical protein